MDRFAICQAYRQLESDYNVNGILRERPSNQRRKESVSCQLRRIGIAFNKSIHWVYIEGKSDCEFENSVREIYMRAVLRLKLPISESLRNAMLEFFTTGYLAGFPQFNREVS